MVVVVVVNNVVCLGGIDGIEVGDVVKCIVVSFVLGECKVVFFGNVVVVYL